MPRNGVHCLARGGIMGSFISVFIWLINEKKDHCFSVHLWNSLGVVSSFHLFRLCIFCHPMKLYNTCFSDQDSWFFLNINSYRIYYKDLCWGHLYFSGMFDLVILDHFNLYQQRDTCWPQKIMDPSSNPTQTQHGALLMKSMTVQCVFSSIFYLDKQISILMDCALCQVDISMWQFSLFWAVAWSLADHVFALFSQDAWFLSSKICNHSCFWPGRDFCSVVLLLLLYFILTSFHP